MHTCGKVSNVNWENGTRETDECIRYRRKILSMCANWCTCASLSLSLSSFLFLRVRMCICVYFVCMLVGYADFSFVTHKVEAVRIALEAFSFGISRNIKLHAVPTVFSLTWKLYMFRFIRAMRIAQRCHYLWLLLVSIRFETCLRMGKVQAQAHTETHTHTRAHVENTIEEMKIEPTEQLNV